MACIDTKKAAVLWHLKRHWMTTGDSNLHCGLNSLAQRVSAWRREGLAIRDKWVNVGGSRVKAYTLAKKPRPLPKLPHGLHWF